MSENDSSAFSILAAITLGHADLISRIAAPLWARVGRPIDASELSWSQSMLGESGPQLLVQALQGFDALDPRTRALSARGVSRFLSSLVGDAAHPHTQKATQSPELVWTLPNSHPSRSIRGQTYLDCCLRLVREAKESLTIGNGGWGKAPEILLQAEHGDVVYRAERIPHGLAGSLGAAVTLSRRAETIFPHRVVLIR
jgi:hypothetical protein